MGSTLSYNVQEHTVDLGPRGKIKGLQYDDKARRYSGVPYALPPTGEHRWRRPRPLPPSFTYSSASQPFDATWLRPPAAQEDRELRTGLVAPENDGIKGTEDCLYVNVWTPVSADAARPARRWPIMVWLHGGWFQVGDACHEPWSDPTELISTGGLDAIVVAVSYRLNVFGFLSSAALLDDGEAAGNFGLWDQRLALEWVHDTMGAFGGDVANVTIAGRSAGAYSVEAQILHDFRRDQSPRAASLFRRAWMSSNAIPAQPRSVADAEAQFDEVCRHFGIPPSSSPAQKLARLRDRSTADVLKCIRCLERHTFRPVTDGLFFHANMAEYLRSGALARDFASRGMKLLIGEVANEESLYAQFNGPAEPTPEALRLQVANYYSPAMTAKLLGQYSLPESNDLGDWKRAFGIMVADGQVRASSRYLVDALSRHGLTTGEIWRYRVDYRLSFIDDAVAPLEDGVSHGMDGPLWNYSINQLPAEEERKMLDAWVKILVAFVGGDDDFDFGTRTMDEVKVQTKNGDIKVEKDTRYDELGRLGAMFSQQ
ncbi:Carboxylesterase, type B [Metarhizium album ARSEF 1941]|uniref:Carboxylic ester hydrolase n=1 Tax=Metarhizium album (strain ARSEF 1941) TaxID=1081103 RepID=A0A0B2WJV9_METAS|nr:Carboxylesterase, type B [Metarhizium album ARSEF 1941]KHN93994.1 Carboxylesterase, type B [Metarhizium album ARSEF 1941]